LKITKQQKENIANIITDLKNGNSSPDLEKENSLIFVDEGEEIEANNFTADVFIEDDDKIICIELKSVKPNAGEMRGEKQKILEAKAVLYHIFPEKKIYYFIGFPFDPTSNSPTGSNKENFLCSIIEGNKYYDPSEVLLASELWDYLSSSKNTMMELLNIINTIAKPDFQDKYNLLIDTFNAKKEKRKAILREWNLFSELELLKNDSIIKEKIKTNSRLKRIYNNECFNNGEYNFDRYFKLIQSIL
jgi:hypothetical protein